MKGTLLVLSLEWQNGLVWSWLALLTGPYAFEGQVISHAE